MQLYALHKQVPILAQAASKKQHYQCPECASLVQVRGGPHRQLHYFHVRKNRHCRQHSKSIAHLKIQLHLKSLIPEVTLEKSFPAIGRIADVAWEERKIVFEIQCSPISKEEVESRCRDYEKAGYTPVWILYAKRFNKRNLTAAESFLRKRPCFFADGFKIYDQFEIIHRGKEFLRGPPLVVLLNQPLSKIPSLTSPPLAVSVRAWPISFQGDLLHRLSEGTLPHLKYLEKRFAKHSTLFSWKGFYRELFYNLLARLTH
ncbi:MAG: hypothetical protein LVR00_08700 [Rhabdochlamydiaceae bacterium]|jgi:competence protein CoiA